jgi:hypothetical protein
MIPQDDAFYLRLIQMARTIGAKPEDLIVVMASETNLDPGSTRGKPFRGLNTMGLSQAQSAGISADDWARLPDMTPTQNLDYSEKFFLYLLKSAGRNKFVNALDLYLSNAAFGIWVKPPIMPDTVMYGGGPGNPWASNYAMDNYPAGVGLTLDQARAEIGHKLKGYVSVEDLRQFMLRSNVESTWKGAVKKLASIQAQAGLENSPDYSPVGYVQYNPSGGYVPDTSYDEINAARGTPTHIDGNTGSSGVSGIPTWAKWLGGFVVALGAYRVIKK